MLNNELLGIIIVAIAGPAGVGSIFLWLGQGLVRQVNKINPLEQRIITLEVDQGKNNKTAEEVIRLQEQVKFLIDEVRRMAAKLDNHG